MFPKFRRTRIRNLEPATLAELKQYIDSRLVPPESNASGDTVRLNLDEMMEASAPPESVQASREAPEMPPLPPSEDEPQKSVLREAKTFPRPPMQGSAPFGAARAVRKQAKAEAMMEAPAMRNASLSDALSMLDESFADMLFRKIDERGMTDARCYKKAGIDRKLFSKIRSNRLYKPSRPTAVALAVALELSMDETKELLMKAGYALSHSSKFDIIIEFFIGRGNYDRFQINEALYEFDQQLI